MAGVKEAISTDRSPAAIGPYSQAVRSADLLFISGQIPLDPADGALVPGGVREQTEQVLKNLVGVLSAAGLELGNVLKTTVYLTDMGSFAEMNEVYAKFFSAPYPARAAVEVAALPKDARVEIEAVARAG